MRVFLLAGFHKKDTEKRTEAFLFVDPTDQPTRASIFESTFIKPVKPDVH